MADIGNLLTPDQLAHEKRKLLEQWLEQEGIRPTSQAITPEKRKNYSQLPLSFAQQRLWFLDQLEPGSPFYNLPHPVRLKGKLDAAVLEASLNHVAQRHETLRTTFHEENGKPVQRIAEGAGLHITVTELTHLPELEQEHQAHQLASEEARRPFDLQRGPLLRAHLLRLGPEDHLLLLTMHHIISDGWSLDIFIRETGAFYEALLAGGSPALQPLPIQYADYAIWQREQLEGDFLEQELQYWRHQLGGTIAPLQLPADYPRPALQKYRGAQSHLELTRGFIEQVTALARSNDITLFMFLLAGYKLLLHRYSGQEDIVAGSPIANRTRPEIEELIGYFANTLALRSDLSGDPTVEELLARVRETALGAYAHQDIPFEKLLEDLQPPRDPSRQPVFQAVFALQNLPSSGYTLPNLAITPVDIDTGTSKFDLTLIAQESSAGLSCTLEYNTDLFSRSTASRLLDHFHNLLRGMVENPKGRISEIPLLGNAEKAQLVKTCRRRSEYTVSTSLVELFEAGVKLHPEARAAGFGEQWLTYKDINERANQLAHYLLAEGIGPEMLVGILAERTLDLVISILGILKTGAAYLPLDPAYPPERLDFMLHDSGAAAVLVQKDLRDRLASAEVKTICLEDERETIAREDRANPAQAIIPGQAAYVIYTSGSTGQPKGVVVSHANVVRLFQATQEWFNFRADDVWTLFHSCAFDFSVWELWGALLYGGRLVIVPYWVTRSPDVFLDLLIKEKVTILNQTPSAFRQLIEAEGALPYRPQLALREVIFGGEALDFVMLKPWLERHPDCPRLVNMYGITETTVHVTWRPVSKQETAPPKESRIGVAIPDLEIYILDRHMLPVPPAVAGEIFVGGAGVARGYLRRPELTAERFVPNPFATVPGDRLYKTGDLGRYRGADLEYLGRVDQQVKIRGFRIELGEIENVFRQHPQVQDCVAALHQESSGEKRLVLYVAAKNNHLPSSSDLRHFAGSTLPDYMLPASVMYLEALPLTAHGKIDRRGLPVPEHSRPELEESYVPPATDLEKTLAEIWSQVLHLERVGVEDNYFTLGGDSIRSIEVRAHAHARGLDLSIQQLFQYQTIRELAQQLNGAGAAAAPNRVQPFSLLSEEDRQKLPAGLEDAYPLSSLQSGMVFHSEYSADYLIYITTFHLRGRFDLPGLRMAIDYVTRRHPMLRTSFDLTDFSGPLQFVHPGATILIEVEDLRHLTAEEQEAEIARWMEAEKHRSFEWNSVPLLRVHLHRRGEDSFQFSLSEPFLDGWSVASLVTEIFENYSRLIREESIPPAPLRASYADFVALEQQTIASEESRRYWSEKFSDANGSRITGTSLLRQQSGSPRVGRIDVPISHQTSNVLHELAAAEGLSIKSILLAAHCKVISVLSGQSGVFTGLFMNGRPEIEDGEKLIGMFLNILPFKLSLEAENWSELARRVAEEERRLLPHRRYPIQRLQHLYGAENLFDTAFNFTHFHVYQRLLKTGEIEGASLSGTEQTYYALTAQFNLDEALSRITLALDYRELSISPEDVEKAAGYYSRVLSAMADAPFASHEAICFLSQAEQYQLLAQWNHTFMDYPKEQSFLALFEKQAELVPHAPAAIYGEEQLTYRELNERANQLGHHLRSLGVGPETLVGICMQRTNQMTVGLLGILKSGGAYVPLDPQYPAERLKFMLEDTQIRVLVTQSDLKEILPQRVENTVCLDTDWPTISHASTANVHSGLISSNVAYLVYTSGSTGKPKGAAIEHHSTLGLMHWAQLEFGRETLAGVLAASSICFDMSVFEIYVPLSWGGAVIMAENVLQLHTLAAKNKVTFISTVPSAIAELSRLGWVPETTRAVLLAGEVLPEKIVNQIFELTSIEKVWNLYGLSEDTSYTTAALMEKGSNTPVTIGRPIANRQLYVLNQQLQPVPRGVTGELHVSGEGLARGYVNRPELTAERFIPDPFSSEPGVRMYRTGDLVRYRPDARMECLGRIDHQLKIRGYRIELGEIESVLGAYPGVKTNAVVLREDVAGEKQLVAYVVPKEESHPTSSDLRAYLKTKVPDWMAPSAILLIEQMPMTSNGKVDRKALPAPAALRLPEKHFVAPHTFIQELLAGIWRQVLKLEKAGIHDNFFESGGHSLNATQVISRARNVFHIELHVHDLFASPTIAGLAGIVTGKLKDSKLQAPPLLRTARSGPLPLSFAQQRLWFIDRLESGSPFYNIPVAVHLKGELDTAVLEKCVNEIVQRHEILRTSFVQIDREPAQIIVDRLTAPLTITDLTHLSQAEQEQQISLLVHQDVQRAFDLEKPPLLRLNVFRLSPEDHLLLAVMHHIVSDGWSLGIFVHELTELYAAFSAGQASPLPPLQIQYADYAVWQREWLSGDVLDSQLDYWKDRLAGAPPELGLPVYHPYPGRQTYQGRKLTITLSPAITKDIKALAANEGVTLFMALLAAWKILLAQRARQSDLVIGTAIAGRNHSEIEPLIGFFVNTLPLRTDLSGNPSLRDLLHRVRETCLAAYAHQDLPFEKLVEQLQPRRDSVRAPIVQVMFVLENAPLPELRLGSLQISSFPIDSGSAKFELALLVSEDKDTMSCNFEYNTALFEEQTIARMVQDYQAILQQMIAQPALHLHALEEALDHAALHQVLSEFSRSGNRPLPEAAIHQLFEQQAGRTPDVLAIVTVHGRLTYRDLNRRANQLARELQKQGIGVESRVAIFMERSAEMFIAVLAVLKAGAAYVPLNPQHPAERTRFLLSDATPTVLLTQQHLQAMLPAANVKTIAVDAPAKAADDDTANLQVPLSPECLAYVIYTSGSTGNPKGSMVSHRALVNHALQMVELYDLQPGRRMLQFFPLSFDASAEDIFPVFLSGATLVCPADSFAYAPQELLVFCEQHEITTAHLPVVLWHHMTGELSSGKLAVPAHLRMLSVGGESPSLESLAQWSRITGGRVAFRNMYGPTEATITATAWRHDISGPSLEHRTRVPIGRPLQNISIYILNEEMGPVPPGVPGEIHLGGVALARGYLNQAALTAEKFIPDPFSAACGARLYKTGDLGQFSGNGEIEFLGRIDHQIKIRGHRVELEEIERALLQHPAIQDTAVIVHGNGVGDKRLAAYATLKPGQPATLRQVRNYLKERLPDYMLPSWFMVLNSLPLTSSGKLDRKALPIPTNENPGSEQEYFAPRTPVEEIVAAIFAELLQREQVGIFDHFFECGGHSLLAVQLASHLRETFQVEVSLRRIFEGPTVAGIAEALLEDEDERPRVQRRAELMVKLVSVSDDQAESMVAKPLGHEAKEQVS
ncbi:MAG: non-ribosomal peptide synthetase [Candidatus Angelobacter sp. Gp1-AA117]|nr:MAG: non-ribosomal peptide synthetase [Candidatus Angelobacter sp. Gp1-AA117]